MTAAQLMEKGYKYAVLSSASFKEVTNPENGTPFFTLEQATACAKRMNNGEKPVYHVADYEEILADTVEDDQAALALFIGRKLQNPDNH